MESISISPESILAEIYASHGRTMLWWAMCAHSVVSDSLRAQRVVDSYSPPGFSLHGNFQARTLEWVAISSSRASSQPRDRTCISCVSCIGRQILCRLGSPILTWINLKNKMLAEKIRLDVCITPRIEKWTAEKCLEKYANFWKGESVLEGHVLNILGSVSMREKMIGLKT